MAHEDAPDTVAWLRMQPEPTPLFGIASLDDLAAWAEYLVRECVAREGDAANWVSSGAKEVLQGPVERARRDQTRTLRENLDILADFLLALRSDPRTASRHFVGPGRRWPDANVARAFRDMEQGTPPWNAIRPFYFGGSTLAAFCNVNPYTAPETAYQIALGAEPGQTFGILTTQSLFPRGHRFEALGVRILASTLGDAYRIVHIGSRVSPFSPYFTHSPDGIVEEVATGKAVALVEVKCQQKVVKECPPLYTAQVVKGMSVHGVTCTYFVTVVYAVPELNYDDDRMAICTIERLDAVPAPEGEKQQQQQEPLYVRWMRDLEEGLLAELQAGNKELSKQFIDKVDYAHYNPPKGLDATKSSVRRSYLTGKRGAFMRGATICLKDYMTPQELFHWMTEARVQRNMDKAAKSKHNAQYDEKAMRERKERLMTRDAADPKRV